MKKKSIKGWAVCENGVETGFELVQVGEGNKWRYPIFPTIDDAIKYRAEAHGVSRIVPVLISFPARNKKQKEK